MSETSIIGVLLLTTIFILAVLKFMAVFKRSSDTEPKLFLFFNIMVIINFLVAALFSFPLQGAIPPLFLMISLGIIVTLDINVITDNLYKTIQIKKYNLFILLAISAATLLFTSVFNYKRIKAESYALKSSYFNSIKKWDIAKKAAERSIEIIPFKYKTWYELATACENLGNTEEAIEYHLNALKFHPNLLNSQAKLGQLYVNQGAYVASTMTVTGAATFEDFIQLPSKSLTDIKGITPTAVGQVYYANDDSTEGLWVSTGTAEAAFVLISGGAIE